MSLVVFCCFTQALLLAKTLKAIRTEGKNLKTRKNTKKHEKTLRIFPLKSYFLLFLNFLTIFFFCLWINMFMSLEIIRERRRGEKHSFNHLYIYISYIHRNKKIATRSKIRVNWSKKHGTKKMRNDSIVQNFFQFLFFFPNVPLSNQHLDLVSLTATSLGFSVFLFC